MGKVLTERERFALRKEMERQIGFMPEDQPGLTEDDVPDWRAYWASRTQEQPDRMPWDEEVVPAAELGAPRPAARPVQPREERAPVQSGSEEPRDEADRALTRQERFRLRMHVWDLAEGPGAKRGACPPDEPGLTLRTVNTYVRRYAPHARQRIDLAAILDR